jgi:hypothetical protein
VVNLHQFSAACVCFIAQIGTPVALSFGAHHNSDMTTTPEVT